MQRNMTDCDDIIDDQLGIDIRNTFAEAHLESTTNEVCLIDEWFKDPEFAIKGQAVDNVSSVAEPDKQIWYTKWIPPNLKHQHSIRSIVHLKKKELPDRKPAGNKHENYRLSRELKEQTRRENNRRYAKESRERKKQSHLDEEQNFQDLSEKKRKLTEDIEDLKHEVESLNIVNNSLIHQECCGRGYDEVAINNSHSKLDLVVQDEDEAQDFCDDACSRKYYSGDTTLGNDGDEQMTQIRQEQQPIQQEVEMQASPSSPVKLNNNVVPFDYFTQNNTSFQSMSSLLPTFVNQFLFNQYSDPTPSANLEVRNIESSMIASENAVAVNTGRFSEASESRQNNIARCSQVSSYESPWCVDTNQEADTEFQNLKSSFAKSYK